MTAKYANHAETFPFGRAILFACSPLVSCALSGMGGMVAALDSGVVSVVALWVLVRGSMNWMGQGYEVTGAISSRTFVRDQDRSKLRAGLSLSQVGMSRNVLMVFVLFPLFMLLGDARAKESVVTRLDGEAIWKLHGVDGSVQWVATNSFRVLVAPEGWKIEYAPLQKGTGPSVMSGSDSLDTYQILNNDHLAGISSKVSGKTVTNSLTQIGSVVRGIYPRNAPKEVQVLWMAFIYARCLTNATLPKIVELSGIDYSVSRDARFSAQVDHNGDLKQAEYFSTGEVMYDKQMVHLSAPWDKGYVLWRLESVAGNAGENGAATSLLFLQNLPISATNIMRQWTAEILTRNITTAKSFGSNTFLPSFTNNSLVTFDYRFSPNERSKRLGGSGPMTMYYLSKGQWLNREQAELYNKGYREIRVVAAPEQVSGARRLVAIGLFGLSSIGALVVAWKVKTKIKGKT